MYQPWSAVCPGSRASQQSRSADVEELVDQVDAAREGAASRWIKVEDGGGVVEGGGVGVAAPNWSGEDFKLDFRG